MNPRGERIFRIPPPGGGKFLGEVAYGKIAKALAEAGHRPRGRCWHPQTVARMVPEK